MLPSLWLLVGFLLMSEHGIEIPAGRRRPYPAERRKLFYEAREKSLAAPGNELEAANQYLSSIEWLNPRDAREIARKAVQLLHITIIKR